MSKRKIPAKSHHYVPRVISEALPPVALANAHATPALLFSASPPRVQAGVKQVVYSEAPTAQVVTYVLHCWGDAEMLVVFAQRVDDLPVVIRQRADLVVVGDLLGEFDVPGACVV